MWMRFYGRGFFYSIFLILSNKEGFFSKLGWKLQLRQVKYRLGCMIGIIDVGVIITKFEI